ncbi:succinate dehydrogenase [Schaalia hyovaginalis]|uniref:Succinate dehydrogenase / fumarate reductase cytochrome b subunit n=1 Tax=Schaalia hyovaginalis TaxID=29316 RepID=A0A923E2I5_9ACTO|nr:succinate dehydrogenase [Schaalia hyovaginalis]MBB6334798.1 succinate dehydrogenase / fumarate reductase cytochrome b subunit [Schaalia hyovaginalis]MDY2668200.1 succinate dehydrogenase [Schaalia hyovaginalis]
MPRAFAGLQAPERRPPSWVLRSILALSGLVMAAFVLVHMLGNLKLLIDPESMDAYAAWLRDVLVPLLPREGALWIARILLASCLIAHAWSALVLKARAAATRTRGARRKRPTGILAALMLPSGLILLAFIAVHLLDLTLGRIVQSEAFAPPDPQFHAAANVIASLARPAMAAFYALSLLALAAHLLHGIGLAAKDLGAVSRGSFALWRIVGVLVAAMILLGDGAIVIASLMTGAPA